MPPALLAAARAARAVRAAAAALLVAGLGAACADDVERAPVGPAAVSAAPAADAAPGTAEPPPGTPAARPGTWTVMVYLAADNNLARDGVIDLGEMEAAVAQAAAHAGAPPDDVQVVVEAEFSPQYLAQAGCGRPECIGRPNWNTFRYRVAGRAADAPGVGPAGEVLDLGANRDMTRPEELREFVQWARAHHPAEHYLLVVWNHGGGYTGLIADETSAPGRLMTMAALRSALADVGPIDVLDFDMCLMAGYETLAQLQGLVGHVVFSEAVVPGAGNDYRALLGRLFSDPTATPARVAADVADAFHAAYRGSRASTTVSAYALAGYPAFAARLADLARLLGESAETSGPLVRDAASRAQRFEQPGLHDLGDLLATMAAQVDAGSPLHAAIRALQATATDSAFRLRSLARSGTGQQAANVDRATGLHILAPSGRGTDRIAEAGPGSFDAYAAQLPDEEWTRFLADYLRGDHATPVVDQGPDDRFEAYLVWDPEAAAHGADIDFWLIEPDGTLYIPYLGRVTPNGQMTNDSVDDDTFFEGWASFRTVARGPYYILANLFDDPEDYRPRYNLGYRFRQADDFAPYLERPATMSRRRSWLDDPDATFERVFLGAYTDLRPVAVWEAEAPDATTAGARLGVAAPAAGRLVAPTAAALDRAPRLTARQLAAARGMVAGRRAARARMQADVAEPRGVPHGMPRGMPSGMLHGLERLLPR